MSPILIPLLVSLPLHSDPPMLALKTNIPAWGATILNIEPEFYFSSRFSGAIGAYWCPWFISERKALRVGALQPEVRFHFPHSPFGHYLGIHASLAWFNLCLGNYRYQDSRRPLAGAGISYGYTLRLGKNWLADFSIGAGMASLQYDRFYNVDNGVKIDTRRTLYWGIDKISISIGYIIDL